MKDDYLKLILNERKKYDSAVEKRLDATKIAATFIAINADRIAYKCSLSDTKVDKIAKNEIINVFPSLSNINEKDLIPYLRKKLIFSRAIVEIIYSFIIYFFLLLLVICNKIEFGMILLTMYLLSILILMVADSIFDIVKLYYKLISLVNSK